MDPSTPPGLHHSLASSSSDDEDSNSTGPTKVSLSFGQDSAYAFAFTRDSQASVNAPPFAAAPSLARPCSPLPALRKRRAPDSSPLRPAANAFLAPRALAQENTHPAPELNTPHCAHPLDTPNPSIPPHVPNTQHHTLNPPLAQQHEPATFSPPPKRVHLPPPTDTQPFTPDPLLAEYLAHRPPPVAPIDPSLLDTLLERCTPAIVARLKERLNLDPMVFTEPATPEGYRLLVPGASVFVVKDKRQFDACIQIVVQEWNRTCPQTQKVIGLDLETVRNTPSTIQIAFAADLVIIFQVYHEIINKTMETLPPLFAAFLAHRDIVVTGVSVVEDCAKICRHLKGEITSIADGGKIAAASKVQGISLRSLYYKFVHPVEPAFKGRMSGQDWSAETLTQAAVIYGANDAIASLLLLRALMAPNPVIFADKAPWDSGGGEQKLRDRPLDPKLRAAAKLKPKPQKPCVSTKVTRATAAARRSNLPPPMQDASDDGRGNGTDPRVEAPLIPITVAEWISGVRVNVDPSNPPPPIPKSAKKCKKGPAIHAPPPPVTTVASLTAPLFPYAYPWLSIPPPPPHRPPLPTYNMYTPTIFLTAMQPIDLHTHLVHNLTLLWSRYTRTPRLSSNIVHTEEITPAFSLAGLRLIARHVSAGELVFVETLLATLVTNYHEIPLHMDAGVAAMNEPTGVDAMEPVGVAMGMVLYWIRTGEVEVLWGGVRGPVARVLPFLGGLMMELGGAFLEEGGDEEVGNEWFEDSEEGSEGEDMEEEGSDEMEDGEEMGKGEEEEEGSGASEVIELDCSEEDGEVVVVNSGYLTVGSIKEGEGAVQIVGGGKRMVIDLDSMEEGEEEEGAV
ncbi:hypothetical protein HDU98_006555 [Podochytrium sp. JEL0797]|nr:hypothetical protein HDU98_006555 [Podochytrium sp. JEL0797]